VVIVAWSCRGRDEERGGCGSHKGSGRLRHGRRIIHCSIALGPVREEEGGGRRGKTRG